MFLSGFMSVIFEILYIRKCIQTCILVYICSCSAHTYVIFITISFLLYLIYVRT